MYGHVITWPPKKRGTIFPTMWSPPLASFGILKEKKALQTDNKLDLNGTRQLLGQLHPVTNEHWYYILTHGKIYMWKRLKKCEILIFTTKKKKKVSWLYTTIHYYLNNNDTHNTMENEYTNDKQQLNRYIYILKLIWC